MPRNALIHHGDGFDVIERGRLRQSGIRHTGIDAADFDAFEQHHEIHFLSSRIVDAIPLDFGGLQRLPLRHGLVEIGCRRVEFLFERNRRMCTLAGDLAISTINRQIYTVAETDDFNASFAVLDG